MGKNIDIEQEEFILPNCPGRNEQINILRKKGINTVEDFLNADKRLLYKYVRGTTRQSINLTLELLNYKYNGVNLTVDAYLDEIVKKEELKEYINSEKAGWKISEINNKFNQLGFYFACVEEYIYNNFEQEEISIIDIIKQWKSELEHSESKIEYQNLMNFYINYYEKKVIKDNDNSTENIETLKKEIINLVNKRNDLDKQISQLKEQVATLEGGSKTNGRK